MLRINWRESATSYEHNNSLAVCAYNIFSFSCLWWRHEKSWDPFFSHSAFFIPKQEWKMFLNDVVRWSHSRFSKEFYLPPPLGGIVSTCLKLRQPCMCWKRNGCERINEEAFILREIIFFKSSTLFEMGLWTKLPLKVRQPDHWT